MWINFFLNVFRNCTTFAQCSLKGEATQSRDHIAGGFTGSPFVAAYAIDGSFETSVSGGRGACAIAERVVIRAG